MLGEDGAPISLPFHYDLTQTYVENEVFEVAKVPPRELSVFWSISSTVAGQQLLTVWDTGVARRSR